MVGVSFYLIHSHDYLSLNFSILDYGLLILTTVIIAAAGNLINDYFDVKADRVNRPQKLIITKHLKKRWAILIHWTLNILAVFFSILLSIRYNSFLFLFVHLMSMNLLWFYSVYFKKKLFIGNVIIAGLTAVVPLLAVWYFKIANESNLPYNVFKPETWSTNLDYSFVYFTAFCAFFQNLSREISKDIQDVKGDKLIHVVSLPMKYGVNKAGWMSLLILQIPLFTGIIVILKNWIDVNLVSLILLGISALINLSTIFFFLKRKDFPFELVNTLIKWGMLVGVVSLFTNTL